MKKILTLTCLLFCLNVLKAQKTNNLDTIYVICKQEQQISKYHYISSQRDSFNTLFSFKVDWQVHGYKKTSIEFSFNSLSEHYKPGRDFFVKFIDTNVITRFKNLYTLEQFTKALNKEDLLVAVWNRKIKVIMLYGAACLDKVEVYPVEVATDLSSEG